MLGDQRLELVDELRVAAELEVGVDPRLDRREPALTEVRDLLLRELFERKILERVATPQRQRGAQQLGTRLCRRSLRLLHEAVEAREIEPLRIDTQDVTGRLELDRLGPERLAQARDVVLQRCRRRLRRTAAPERLDQSVARNRFVRMQQQIGEQ